MYRIVNFALIALILVQDTFGAGLFDFTELDDPFSAFTSFNRNSLFRNILGSECTVTTTDGDRTGVCKSPIECKISGGRSGGRGSCTFNSCCVYEGQCGSTTSKKISYFYNPKDIPESEVCSFTVRASSTAVCQVRLDFEQFEIAGPVPGAAPPAENNLCTNDNFEVAAPNKFDVPRICGYNTGQHMYIPMNASNDELSLKLTMNIKKTRTGLIENPKWKIRITQLECPSLRALSDKNAQGYTTNTARDFYKLAPAGCLQYFTEKSGTVSTFNYRSVAAGATNPSRYIGGLNYAICLQRRVNTCKISFSAAANDFSLAARDAATGTCTTDFLFIPETALSTGPVPNYKYCGTDIMGMTTASTEIIAGIVTRNPSPLYLHFVSDKTDTGVPTGPTPPSVEFGFKIQWDMDSSCN